MKNEGNIELLTKIDMLLADEKELIILKGKLTQPLKHTTNDGKGIYYTFQLRTLKKLSSDEYGTAFNTYHCVMPVDVAKRYSDDELSSCKDNEVLCILSANCRTKKLTNDVVVNNITFFVNDMVLTRTINNTITNSKVINL